MRFRGHLIAASLKLGALHEGTARRLTVSAVTGSRPHGSGGSLLFLEFRLEVSAVTGSRPHGSEIEKQWVDLLEARFRGHLIAASLKRSLERPRRRRVGRFPRSPDRGLIEAAGDATDQRIQFEFPRSPDRGLIEASGRRRPPAQGTKFPRSPDRGLIEAQHPQRHRAE